jgi:ABC-type branched-subunit amino acid transport system ATPase component/MFS family permease
MPVRRKEPARAATRGNVAAVDEIARTQQELRARSRIALGIAGDEDTVSLREGIARSGAGWYPLVALGLLFVVDEFQRYAFFVLGPEVSRTLGISRGVLALVLIVQLVAITLAVFPLAALVQRKPRRALVAISTAFVWSVVTGLTAFVGNVWGLLGALTTQGAATGSVRATHAPLLADTYPPDTRVRAFAAYNGFQAVGNVLAPLLVAILVTAAGLTWRGTFLVLGVVCTVAAAGALRLRDPGFGRWDVERVRTEVRGGRDDDGVHHETQETELGFFEIVRRILLIPSVRRIVLMWAMWGAFLIPFQTFFFFFLDERWNMGPGARGTFIGLVALVALPALAVFGRRGEGLFRADPGRLVSLAVVVVLVAIASLSIGALAPWFGLMTAAFAIATACISIMPAFLGVLLMSVVQPRMRAHAAALGGIAFAAVGGVGGLMLLSGVDRRFGLDGAMIALALPGLVTVLLLRSVRTSVVRDIDRLIDEVIEEETIANMVAAGQHLPLLSCRRIDFSYGQLQVLFDVNFTVDDGEMVALLGTNGAGKSTLLRVISGLGLPSSGHVHFRGADITFLDAERRVALGVTQVPGGRAVFGPLSVVDNLRVYGHSLGRNRAAIDRGIDLTLDAFPRLAERRNQPAAVLSGGEKQMLALGKAFLLEPRLLLIDELSLGLAPKVVGELLEMVRRINGNGTAIVLVEQSVNIALSLVDHAYFMEKGEIRFDGRAGELLGRPDLLRSVFLEGAGRGMVKK